MSILVSVEEADFVYLREKTNATSVNLSVQIDKLNIANYISVTKIFKGKNQIQLVRLLNQDLKHSKSILRTLKTYFN